MVDIKGDNSTKEKTEDTKFMNKIGNKLVEEQSSTNLDVSKKVINFKSRI